MDRRVVIEVWNEPPGVAVDGLRIETAPPVGELVGVLGVPTRVETGKTPAPVGFRNNQIHIFDSLGLSVNEDHHTRRAGEICLALAISGGEHRLWTKQAFAGVLRLGGKEMPLRATEREFLEASPWPFRHVIGPYWQCKFGEFGVMFDVAGARLASGRRSRRRVVTSVSISWPHDHWGAPANSA